MRGSWRRSSIARAHALCDLSLVKVVQALRYTAVLGHSSGLRLATGSVYGFNYLHFHAFAHVQYWTVLMSSVPQLNSPVCFRFRIIFACQIDYESACFRTNKCGIVQLLGHYTEPYEIYHLINCPCYLVYFHVGLRMLCAESAKRIFRFCCST